MSYNIDEIMDMLDWKQPQKIQKMGCELAANINCFHVFLRPGYPKYNKNVWDNCAKIISNRIDEELRPYIMEMFEWLEDMNWPGAFCIWDRLKQYGDKEWLNSMLNHCIYRARVLKQDMWLDNLREFQGPDILQQSTDRTVNEIFARRMYESLVEENTNLYKVILEIEKNGKLTSESNGKELELYHFFSEEEKCVFMDVIKRIKIDTIYSLFRVLDGYGKEYDRQQFEIKLQINEQATGDELAAVFRKVVKEMDNGSDDGNQIHSVQEPV